MARARAVLVPILIAVVTACGDDDVTSPAPQLLDPSATTVSVADGFPGLAREVVVHLRDTEGGVFTGRVGDVRLEVRGVTPDTSVTAAEGTTDGSRVLAYVPRAVGDDSLFISIGGQPLADAPVVSPVSGDLHAAAGTPTIDGVLEAGEWDDAVAYPVFAGAMEGSTLRIKSDGTHLFFAFRAPVPGGEISGISVRFDNLLDGLLNGDDVIVARHGSNPPFLDQHFGPAIFPDLQRDGEAAAQGDAGWTVFELSHPLDSGDPDDISVGPTASLGICLALSWSRLITSSERSFPAECILTRYQQDRYLRLRLPG